MKRYLFWPYQLYYWLIVGPYLVVSTAFFGIVSMIMVFTVGPKIASTTCGVAWARLLCYLTPVFVGVSGRENIDLRQSYVVIANHQSQYDILVLYGWLGIDFKWVMKHELRNIPILGVACEKIGHIFIDRRNTTKAIESINAAKKIITGGTSVLFFPEGTRNDSGELAPFKKGAFRMALDLGLPLLPVSITGTSKVLPSKSVLPFPGRVEMKIHPPIETTGYDNSNIAELVAKSRDVLSHQLS